jgi:hypothetical protein
MTATNPQLTVWYNTRYPVCNAGIDWQRSRLVQAARAGLIDFRDINLEPDALARFCADVNDVRRRLHAVDADGKLYVGADCAMAIWRRLLVRLGSDGSLARRSFVPWRASPTTGSPMGCSRGIAGWGIGRQRRAANRGSSLHPKAKGER